MRRDRDGRWTAACISGALALAVLVAACSSDSKSPVAAAQARVTKAEQGVTDAQAAYGKATTQFCGDTKDYVAALDRYGKVFDQSAATVGDVRTAGADLEKPRASVKSSAAAVTTARDDLADAKRELADAHETTEAYTAAKQGWVNAAFRRAESWAQATGWEPAPDRPEHG